MGGCLESAERIIRIQDEKITHLLSAPDGRALTGSDGGVQITNVLNGKTEVIFSGFGLPPGLYALAVNANGWVIAGEDRGRHKLRNIFTNEERYIRPGHDGFYNATVTSAALTADNRLISTGGLFSDDQYLLWVWDVASSDFRGKIRGHKAQLHTMALDEHGLLWTASRDRSVRLIDVDAGKVLAMFKVEGMPMTLAPLPDGCGVIIGDIGGRLSRWDLIGGTDSKLDPRAP